MQSSLQEKEGKPGGLHQLNADPKKNPRVRKVACTAHSLHRLEVSPFKSGLSFGPAPNPVCNVCKTQRHIQSTFRSPALKAPSSDHKLALQLHSSLLSHPNQLCQTDTFIPMSGTHSVSPVARTLVFPFPNQFLLASLAKGCFPSSRHSEHPFPISPLTCIYTLPCAVSYRLMCMHFISLTRWFAS